MAVAPEPIDDDPACWVCGAHATHVNTGFVGHVLGRNLYVCPTHAVDIDDTPIEVVA